MTDFRSTLGGSQRIRVATPPDPPRRGKWIVGIALICAGIAGIAVWALASPGAVAYYATPSELRGSDAAHTLRLGGRVASLERDAATVRFRVTDGHQTVPVLYRGEVPDTLKNGTDVIAEGRLGPDGTLVATRVMAKCSSKFVPKDKPEQLGRA